MTWILLFVAGTFALIGAELAHARGYSRWLGAVVGWTGFGALLLVALLPERTAHPQLAASAQVGLPAGVARAERQLRAVYLLMGGTFGMLILAGVALRLMPSLERTVSFELVGGPLGAALVLALYYAWGLALYFLYRDPRLPTSKRGGWLVALLFFQIWAALAFHYWRRRELARSDSGPALTGAV